ncbi:uncharacterized protein LOC122717668 isoform X3 [Apis laboriosa]|uniref:uncharacterized protein LOC122717668 isoform X3 n=1 Tax=Apis laboriosa TaxID=183418 RepID=UPI001CC45222|nr:uncharacterized protein LOC122717668 isoform X3 [Apis laboriosa]
MVVGEASIHNIMGGMESTGGVRLHNHKRKLKQRFDIIKKLGQGTYGKVQLGINKETGQEVAIKTIKKCKIETEADLIRIRREIQIMSSVQHPNIIHIYEVFENREKMVLVMEYAAGGELYDYLSERKVLTEHEARRIFRQIATAVFYCHKHKICHRDLKLENILLDQVGNAKIADFGLSNVFDEQRLLNTFCGSPLYASPEIVKGTPYHGPEVDCWSLGVLLYTLVYGAMPFDGSNFKRLVKQISQSDYFEPKKPSPASPLIKDMLTVCPGRRADIERICTHWWVNEGYEQNCLDIAEELAAQTPVRLDLLLSLVPQSASAEKLVIGDQQSAGDVPNNVSSETLVPTRCHSVGSLMELDQSSSDRRIRRELLEEEPRTAPIGGDAKRKLETTPSMDETAAADAKRKERSRRKEKRDEPEPRMYKSASRHHSAPIPNSITEEAMEVDPMVTVPISKTVDLNKIESTAACLELIKECSERSPSKERSKTPVVFEEEQPLQDVSRQILSEDRIINDRGCDDEYSKNECRAKSMDDGHRDEIMSKPSETMNLAFNQTNISAPSKFEVSNEKVIGNERFDKISSVSQDDAINLEATQREFKKLKEKALSLDSELCNEVREVPAKTFERRRSKIFETAEKFNQMASSVESEKPKKIFIPGVNVGGAKRVFERKASLSSITTPPPMKHTASKMIIDVPSTTDTKRNENSSDKSKQTRNENEEVEMEGEEKKKEEAKKRAVDIISGAIGKPPMQRRINGSPPISPSSQEPKKISSKVSSKVGTNDLRSTTESVSMPNVETNFSFDEKTVDANRGATVSTASEAFNNDEEQEEPKMSSKMEITLKSATLPRPRKTSKAEISMTGAKSSGAEFPFAFKSELEAKIDAFQPQKLRTQRSEVAFPVAAAVPQTNRSSSLEPETRPRNIAPKERIIPIQMETDNQQSPQSSTSPPSKLPPMPQRSVSQRSGSLSRQSTADSDTDSALGSTVGPEPIRKSPREYIIPIAVEGGGYVTPRSGSVEPETKTGSSSTSTNVPRSRFGRPRRMSSLLSDASEDESPFSSLHRDSEDLLQRHMHRLRSSRPTRQPSEHADSLSSGEDDDDDGFELLTAENLFSTLLSRVRSLTQRLNVDDNRTTGFPSSRLFGRLGSNSSQAFWGLNKPLSRRLSESQFRHSLSREGDIFSRKDSVNSSNPGTPNSPGSHVPSRETVFDIGSNTLPRDKVAREGIEAESIRVRKESQDPLEQSFTPSLARRLSRNLIEQTRRSLTRSPSISREARAQSAERDSLDTSDLADRSVSTISDQTEYKDRSANRRAIRRTNSLLDPSTEREKSRNLARRSVLNLFDDDDVDHCSSLLSTFPRETMVHTLGRWYKETNGGRSNTGKLRKDSFRCYRTEKIQEETADDTFTDRKENNNMDNGSVSESISACDSNANPLDATSSLSTKSEYETSPTESSSNIIDYKSVYKSDPSRNFEDRMLAAENLIKESKLKNLRSAENLSYRDTDKCEKRSLISIGEASGPSTVSKRRSCIPSLRLRSGSLTREPCTGIDRRKSYADSQDVASLVVRALGPEKSLLSKFFKTNGNRLENDTNNKEKETEKENQQKSKQRRISRFLRPDFFDTPREESRYAKEKEAQKAAENERRKSRFIRRKNESKAAPQAIGIKTTATTTSREGSVDREKKREKELKNEINLLRRDRGSREKEDPHEEKKSVDSSDKNTRNGFLHSLEKKLERLRSNDEQQEEKTVMEKAVSTNKEEMEKEISRERSAPPIDHPSSNHSDNIATKANSVEDLSRKKLNQNSSKSKVSSVLGLFKTGDTNKIINGTRSQTAILTKLKKSPPKLVKSDVISNEDATVPVTTSKIPTKLSNTDFKITKKNGDAKKMEKLEKTVCSSMSESSKRLSLKEGSKQEKTSACKEKSASREKEFEGEKLMNQEMETDTREKSNNDEKESVEKKLTSKMKKTNRSSLENGSSVEQSKSEDTDKKAKKLIKKTSETSESNDSNGVKKKKIVRVVKKVAKKSNNDASADTDKNLDEKEKSGKSRIKKKIESKIGTSIAKNAIDKTKENSGIEPKDKTGGKISAIGDRTNSGDETMATETKSDQSKGQEFQQRVNRSNLKLDLSKIPQHSFRNVTPKKDSPKSDAPKNSIDSPKSNEDLSGKLMECLSKVTHHANIAGNKIIIDKPLRAKDVAELKKEVTECAKIIESHAESMTVNNTESENPSEGAPIEEEMKEKESKSTDYPNELFSPMDEPESFDSWSVSSAEMSHARPDLHSPTSPSHSLFSRNDKSDNSESIIDRIRRRSFYSRFNDRRRPSLTAPPPGVNLPTSATLPRKFSFSGHREQRDRSRSRYHSADFSADADVIYKPSLSGLSNDSGIDNHVYIGLGYSSLPRKYGIAEPKTIEYYEELLSPNTTDYLPARRSPISNEYSNKCENGYYNGNLDTFNRQFEQSNIMKRKPSSENARTLEVSESGASSSPISCDEQSTEQKRNKNECTPEVKCLHSTCTEQMTNCAKDHS